MADAEQPLRAGWLGSELALRVGSALVLVPLAIGTAYLGGWPFALFWGAAAMGVLWEWTALVARNDQRSVPLTGGASLALAVVLVAAGHLLAAVVVLAMGAIGRRHSLRWRACVGAHRAAGRRCGWLPRRDFFVCNRLDH